MAGVVKIQIAESERELEKLLKQTSGPKKTRLQALYWLKIGVVETTQDIAVLLNCHRVTVSRWLRTYRESGMKGLLEEKKSPGRPPLMRSQEKLSKNK